MCTLLHIWFICYTDSVIDIEKAIDDKFHAQICEEANLIEIIQEHPVELAYCLALINTGCRYSITLPWVLKNYPAVRHVMYLLRNKPCLRGCEYCSEALDIYKGLKRFFGFDSFRKYAGEPLQEKAVNAAVAGKSLVAVFPSDPEVNAGVGTIHQLLPREKNRVDATSREKVGFVDSMCYN